MSDWQTVLAVLAALLLFVLILLAVLLVSLGTMSPFRRPRRGTRTGDRRTGKGP